MDYPIVSIVFRDITATADWTIHEEVECLAVEVIGYLVERNDRTVKIATARTTENEYSAIHAIPTGCIEVIRTLVETPPDQLSYLSSSSGSGD